MFRTGSSTQYANDVVDAHRAAPKSLIRDGVDRLYDKIAGVVNNFDIDRAVVSDSYINRAANTPFELDKPVATMKTTDEQVWDKANKDWRGRYGTPTTDDQALVDTSEFIGVPRVSSLTRLKARNNSNLVDLKTTLAFETDEVEYWLKNGMPNGYVKERAVTMRPLSDPATYGTAMHELDHLGRRQSNTQLPYVVPKEDKSNWLNYFASPEEYNARLVGLDADLFMQEELRLAGKIDPRINRNIDSMIDSTAAAYSKGLLGDRLDDVTSVLDVGLELRSTVPKAPTLLEQAVQMDRF